VSASHRLSPATARAVDRLARRAHAFHRFAHHPLCGRYASELLSVGRRGRVCRGCAALLAGLPLGGALVWLLRPSLGVLGVALAVAALLGALSLRVRLPKTLGRFVPACGIGAGFVSAFTHPRGFLWLVVLAAVVAGLALYRKRQPNRAPCVTCPERLGAAPCSGLRPIVQRERAFRRVAQRLIDRAPA
jgi:hypothetical protein